jgi:hypothetical protein
MKLLSFRNLGDVGGPSRRHPVPVPARYPIRPNEMWRLNNLRQHSQPGYPNPAVGNPQSHPPPPDRAHYALVVSARRAADHCRRGGDANGATRSPGTRAIRSRTTNHGLRTKTAEPSASPALHLS